MCADSSKDKTRETESNKYDSTNNTSPRRIHRLRLLEVDTRSFFTASAR
jgi:hypothetical protein